MKKTLLLLVSSTYLLANSLQMPPAMPMLNTDVKKETKNQVQATDNCASIPPMLHLLPPPLQESLDKCIIDKYTPSEKKVKDYLDKNKIKYKDIKITPAKDFIRVYKIDLGNNEAIYCNDKMSKCLKD